ncbi:epoxide hydrolase family protein [Saccharomonospora cyanea]|uniref:Putative hydrolase or acyltransferase of alpha/beta superfamily n=1 Tax=Saccharomonospora cyanea NA-134 TaxID=882082 RepID=H5XCH6_9PSEU|nr:epoxide hydrolase family protein [Saccharomonospora cyanea]EHR60191.1 putative hydrolase or acyltransferase of alpha/beta superfamily [Saccharomonospora cyanea NA-134]
MTHPRPFHLDVSESELADLRRRLRATRWPDPEPVDDWSQGVPLAYLRELCGYWADEYDARRVERRLGALPQYLVNLGGADVHVVHVRSPHPEALPLVLTNGWPSSLVEYLDVIGPLTDPTAYGGSASDAFHVVCPTLPGYGFSGKPGRTGWGIERIAAAWSRLMTVLGYDRYGAHGSDWGTSVTTLLALHDTERLCGIHLSPPLAAPDPATFDDLTDAERAALDALGHAKEWEDGYSVQQSTRPQTIGYSLTDSPSGLAAWIVEKFHSWSDCAGHPENAVPRDVLLDNLMMYWLPRTGASSARLYWESIRRVQAWFTESTDDLVVVPTGCTLYPKETPRPSRRWAERRYPNIVHWSEPEAGGHFAALEQPETFVRELREFFRLVR